MNNMQPLVSICCITYNHAPYIRQCLDGFLMQKVTFPIEIIINDDCSTDGTTDVIREYEAKYPDIIKPIYHVENEYSKGTRGMFATYCFPKAKGKYIAMCEGDDYWIDPLKLQMQVDFMEVNPDYSLCFHNALRLNERKTKKEKIKSFCYFNKSRQIQAEEIIAAWCIPTASVLYRREVLVNIQLPSFFSGDYTLELILASRGNVFYIDKYMSVYRLNDGGVSNKVKVRKWAEQLCELLDWFDKFTDFKYTIHIHKRKNDAKKFAKYDNLKRQCVLLPFLFMPYYTYRRIRAKF